MCRNSVGIYARGKALITTHIAIPGCPYIHVAEKIAEITTYVLLYVIGFTKQMPNLCKIS